MLNYAPYRMLLTTAAGLWLALACCGTAFAFSNYNGCESCHGQYNVGNYQSLQDGTNWGSTLMNAHVNWVSGRCQACHLTSGPGEVLLNDSGDTTFTKSCVGCHGRDEDVTDNCTGQADASGGVEVECGSGAGLRQMHEAKVGAGTCNDCHTGDATPVGEDVKPFNYTLGASAIADACDADGSESRVGPTGLDNDGDGQRDAEDADCQFPITAGLNDAWFNPATNGQGFFITVFEDTGLVFLAWFTYDVERPPEDVTAILGEPGHRWVTAQGPFDGDTAVLDVFVSSGGVFDSPVPAVGLPVQDGTITIQWTGCNSAILTYDIPSAGQGMIPLQRVATDNVTLCETLQ
jgi:hypothetical protein